MNQILIALALGMLLSVNGHADDKMRFRAQLQGFNAGGAPVDTIATGEAKVDVIDDGTALAFRVNVENFDNLFMAHIHVADGPVMLTDPAGPPVYWFNGGPPPSLQQILSEKLNGRLAQGYIFNSAQLDSPRHDVTTIEELIMAIEAGRASVIVHSSDFPAGELRGTLQ